MRLYRICHVRYLEDLRGLGASYRDGARWNEPGLPGWDRYPHPRSTQRMGTQWLMRKEAAMLAVPSVAVPGCLESIVLANPNVLDEGTIRLIAVEERTYNLRAFASEQGG